MGESNGSKQSGRPGLSVVEAKLWSVTTHLSEADRRDLERIALAANLRRGRGAVSAYVRLVLQDHIDTCRGERPGARRGKVLCGGGDRRLRGSGVGGEGR